MLTSLIRTILIVVLIIIVFFFIIGNVSLLQSKKPNIDTPYNLETVGKSDKNEDSTVVNELNKYGQHLSNTTEEQCLSAKDQIMKTVRFKRQMEKTKDIGQFFNEFTQHLSPVPNEMNEQKAPILENFEDYAPVDTPTDIPIDKNTINLRQCQDKPPGPVNDQNLQYPSDFYSTRTAPWFDKQGKDDLNYFFDTHTFDKSFDDVIKKGVMCPTEWEKNRQN